FWTAFFERTHRLSCLAADPNSASPKGTLGWADSVPAVALLGCPLGTGTEEYTPLHHIGFRVSVYRFLIFLLAIFCIPQLRAKDSSSTEYVCLRRSQFSVNYVYTKIIIFSHSRDRGSRPSRPPCSCLTINAPCSSECRKEIIDFLKSAVFLSKS